MGASKAVPCYCNPLLGAALEYAAKGWFVFPCRPRDKTPATPHGWKDATTDPAQVHAWWASTPDANIGLACGPSGLVVVDLDGPEGIRAFDRFSLNGSANTLTALTGGGGMHKVYQVPPGAAVRNSAGKVAKSIDIRAAGGYVVAPPSVHPNGKAYQWLDASQEVRPLPDTLLDRLASTIRGKRKSETPGAAIPDHTRNVTLASLAGTMRRRGMSLESIRAALLEENRRCDPPLPDKEVERIAQSVAEYAPHDDGKPHLTDMGNCQRFVAAFGQDVRYCAAWEKWLVWNGQYWRLDDTRRIDLMAKETVRAIFRGLDEIPDRMERDALYLHAKASESTHRLDAMLQQVKSELPVTPDQLDADAWLLNCENGTVDLRKGKLRPHDRADLITKSTHVEYKASAKCPLWLKFQRRITGDSKTIGFKQRRFGYSLTGDTSEDAIFINYGTGCNGKTVETETIARMMGEYATATPVKTLLVKRGDGIPNDLARLKGARFVYASEPNDGCKLDEALVKELTGNDTITARYLYAEWFTFRPSFKITLSTNHKPLVRGTDYGIWRRIHLIPFEVKITEKEKDKHLAEKLERELPGILAWAVKGCLAWQRGGLGVPGRVDAATAAYREEMDTFHVFVEEACLVGREYRTAAGDLYRAYKFWAQDNGEWAESQRAFGLRLEEKGYTHARGAGGVRQWAGIAPRSAYLARI